MTRLTVRERSVLDRVSRGEPTKNIAADLRVSEQAVKAHITRLFRKFGVTSRATLLATEGARRERALADDNAVLEAENARLRDDVDALAASNDALRSLNEGLVEAAAGDRRALRLARGQGAGDRGEERPRVVRLRDEPLDREPRGDVR